MAYQEGQGKPRRCHCRTSTNITHGDTELPVPEILGKELDLHHLSEGLNTMNPFIRHVQVAHMCETPFNTIVLLLLRYQRVLLGLPHIALNLGCMRITPGKAHLSLDLHMLTPQQHYYAWQGIYQPPSIGEFSCAGQQESTRQVQ